MKLDEKSRKIFLRWSWPAFMLAVFLIVMTGEGLLSFLARIEKSHPAVYNWLDLFVTFLPFLFFVGLGLRTPAQDVRARIEKLKQPSPMN
jgi:hypothetical protein